LCACGTTTLGTRNNAVGCVCSHSVPALRVQSTFVCQSAGASASTISATSTDSAASTRSNWYPLGSCATVAISK